MMTIMRVVPFAIVLAVAGCRDAQREVHERLDEQEWTGNETAREIDEAREEPGQVVTNLDQAKVGHGKVVGGGDPLRVKLDDGRTLSLDLEADTRVTRDGKRVAKGALTEGTEIRATWTEDSEDHPVADEIEILRK